MGDLTTNFSRHEFECECGCGYNTVDIELVQVLEDIRSHFFAKSLIITSGCRCYKHNESLKKIGASSKSQHLFAKAADFKVKDDYGYVNPGLIYDYLDRRYPAKFGIGLYGNRVHIDVRSHAARWSKI